MTADQHCDGDIGAEAIRQPPRRDAVDRPVEQAVRQEARRIGMRVVYWPHLIHVLMLRPRSG